VKYPPSVAGEAQVDDTVTGERELYAEEALEILKRVSDEDCEKLGMFQSTVCLSVVCASVECLRLVLGLGLGLLLGGVHGVKC